MENTRNGRQTPLSPAGGSNRDCSVPGKRLMHQIMPEHLLTGDSGCLCHTEGESGYISSEIRGRKTLQCSLPLSWDFQCVILAGFHFSKQVCSKSPWCVCSLSPSLLVRVPL